MILRVLSLESLFFYGGFVVIPTLNPSPPQVIELIIIADMMKMPKINVTCTV